MKDKRAFIAGSTRAWLRSALTLAREGFRLVLDGREADKVKAAAEAIVNQTGTQAYGVAGDVSDASTADESIKDGRSNSLGGLDILITNAGRATFGVL